MEPKHSQTDIRIEEIFELHRNILSIFFKDFEEIFEPPEGLNFTHMKATMVLCFHGSTTMSGLSNMLSLEKGSFTPVANKLIARGIIRKERSAEDKRVYNLVLTERGAGLAEEFRAAHGAFIQSTLDQMEPEDREQYFNLVFRLNEYNRKLKKPGSSCSR